MKYYTYLDLDKGSRSALLKAFRVKVSNWKDYSRVMADHMTIDYGADVPSKYDGEKRALKVVAFGIDDKNAAVLVNSGGLSKNRKPHVTIGVGSGGHGANSNKLKFDENFPSIILSGVVRSVPQTKKKYGNYGGTNKSAACICQGCGKYYKVDVIIPDDLWEGDIKPRGKAEDGGLLCGECIMRKIEERGLHDAFELLKIARSIIWGTNKSAAVLQDLNPAQWKEYKSLFEKKYPWHHPEYKKKMKEFKKKHGFR